MEKAHGRLTWEADALLVCRHGSGKALLVEDQATILALRDSLAWQDAHLECCAGEPDFLVLAYRDGEPVFDFYGYDSRYSGIEVEESTGWDAWLVAPSPLTQADRAALKDMGVRIID